MSDASYHPLVRSAATELVASFGNDSDGEDIRRLFTDETNPRLRRSLLLGYRLLPKTERNYAIAYLPPNDWILKLVGRLVKADAEVNDSVSF